MKLFKSRSEKRIESCRSNLAQRLDSEVAGDCHSKITWLVQHLEEYLERWLAFARLENLTVEGTLHNDVFFIVVAATELIDDQMARLDAAVLFPREEWNQFRNALEWIQKSPERSELQLISDTFESFFNKMPMASDGVEE
jgi:hypothetical protein